MQLRAQCSLLHGLSRSTGQQRRPAALAVRPVRRVSSSSSSSSSRGRRWRTHASSSDGLGDAYDNLFKSKVFQSETAVREFDSITSELRNLSMMASKFADFDVTGKKMYLEKMKEACERYRIFIKRLELTDDPAAREYLRATNAQMLEGGFTMHAMFEGLEQSLKVYESYVAQEEALLSDPAKHQEFTRALKEQWGQSAMGRIDMSYLARVMDPMVLNRAQKDPDFYKCIREVSENPTSATLQKWIDHPTIGPLVAEMFKAMMSKSMGT